MIVTSMCVLKAEHALQQVKEAIVNSYLLMTWRPTDCGLDVALSADTTMKDSERVVEQVWAAMPGCSIVEKKCETWEHQLALAHNLRSSLGDAAGCRFREHLDGGSLPLPELERLLGVQGAAWTSS